MPFCLDFLQCTADIRGKTASFGTVTGSFLESRYLSSLLTVCQCLWYCLWHCLWYWGRSLVDGIKKCRYVGWGGQERSSAASTSPCLISIINFSLSHQQHRYQHPCLTSIGIRDIFCDMFCTYSVHVLSWHVLYFPKPNPRAPGLSTAAHPVWGHPRGSSPPETTPYPSPPNSPLTSIPLLPSPPSPLSPHLHPLPSSPPPSLRGRALWRGQGLLKG